jgi:signal transduction histidine kinase
MEAQELQRRLARQNQLLDCLQRALGHELPNQLVAIQGLARILHLEESERLGPEGRDYLDRMSAATERVHGLVSTLAELIRASRQRPSAEVVSLADALQEAVAEANKLFPKQVIEYHFAETPTMLAVPRRAFHQVLFHLVRCAILVAAGRGRPLRIEVSQRRTNDGAELRLVCDVPGPSHEGRQQAFEAFATESGLKLFLVRQLVEAWGGRIWLESGPGNATEYRVTVPTAGQMD